MTDTSVQIGVVTFWTLGTTSRITLAAALKARGLGAFIPEPTTPLVALFHALREQFPNHLIRKLRGNGFAVVDESRGETDNDYRSLMSATITKDDNPELSFEVKPGNLDPHSLCEQIRGRVAAHLNILQPAAVARMLTNAADGMRATMLRPTGGIYWFSGAHLAQWKELAECVEAAGASNRVYVIRHELDADAIRAVQDSFVNDMGVQARRLAAEVASGELGEKALDGRRNTAMELAARVKEYETILNVSLAATVELFNDIETTAATAALAASALVQ